MANDKDPSNSMYFPFQARLGVFRMLRASQKRRDTETWEEKADGECSIIPPFVCDK